jgi:hypothetical protein
MIELTHEQWQALSSVENPTLVEPDSRTEYVLIRKDVYERWRRVFADEPDAALLVNEMMAEDDAQDPLLGTYQKYRTPI